MLVAMDDAVERLLREHRAAVRALALSILANEADAEDVTQETLLSAVEHRERIDFERNPRAWLLKIAVNKTHDRLRRRKVRAETALAPEALPSPPVPGPDLEAVRRAIRALPVTTRLAMHLAYYEEMPYREIGEALGLSLSAVKMTVLRGRLMIRNALRGSGHEV